MLFKDRISEFVKVETGYHSEWVLGKSYMIYLTYLLENSVLYSKHVNKIIFGSMIRMFFTTRDVD